MRMMALHAGMALLSACVAQAADWPQFLGPHRNGEIVESGLVDKFAEQGPPLLWRRPVGAGFSAPVAAGGQLFVFHQPQKEEILECLDPTTGKQHWSVGYPSDYTGGYGTGPGPRATPTISGDFIVSLGGEGMLQCIRRSDGHVLWRRPLFREFAIPESFFGVACSPLIVDGLVLVNVGAPPDAAFVAFSLESGKTVWQSGNDAAGYSSPVAAQIGEVAAVLFFARTGLHALEIRTGKPLWFFRWRSRGNASVNAATPLIDGRQVFISSSYGTGAALLDMRPDGVDVVWKSDDVLSCHYNTPVLVGGFFYGIDGRQEGGARLRCIACDSGKVAWTEEGYGCADILRQGNRLLLLREDGRLEIAAATPAAFRSLGKSPAIGQGPFRAPPALADGVLFARGDRELVAVDLRAR